MAGFIEVPGARVWYRSALGFAQAWLRAAAYYADIDPADFQVSHTEACRALGRSVRPPAG